MSSLKSQFVENLSKIKTNQREPETVAKHFAEQYALSIAFNLKLEDVENGFILTASQFNYLAKIFSKYTQESWGIYKLKMHPKSGHILHETFPENIVCRSLGLLTEYYIYHFNANFCRDWVAFDELVQENNCEYVLFCEKGKRQDISYFATYSPKIYHEMKTHIGGGRLYHEPSAVAHNISSFDIEIF